MLRVLAVVARLVAPLPTDVTVTEIESSALSAAEWFVDLRLLPREETGALDTALRKCGTDNACVAGELETRGIDRVLYVVVSLESGFATVELIGRSGGAPLATEAVELSGPIDRAVTQAVTRALAAADHARGARLALEVTPQNAQVRVDSSTVAYGEPIAVAAGTRTIEVSAPGFATQRREVELEPGRETRVELRLEPAEKEPVAWYWWGPVAIVGFAAAIIVPIAILSSNDPPTFCYGSSRAHCEMEP